MYSIFMMVQYIRVLCLHGHRQSGPAFRAKLGGFRQFKRTQKRTLVLEVWWSSWGRTGMVLG